VAHFVLLLSHFQPAISTPDANGYFAQARRLATDHRTWFATESVVQFIPPHWLTPDNERYYSKYPPGLPLLAAVAFRLAGPTGALLIDPVMASLSLLGLFLLCRLWIGDGWALLATALMAVNPVVNQQALWAFAHTAVAFFLVWGLFCLARWQRNRTAGWAFAAGCCFGMIPTIRYAEGLFLAGFAGFVLLNIGRDRQSRRCVLAAVLGAAIPIGILCVRSQLAFGAFWRTGYALTNEQTGFGWSYFIDHAVPYLRQLGAEGSGLLFGLGVVGLTILCARAESWKRGVLLVALVVPTTLLYMSYYWAPDGAAMRFLVPTLFIYAIAGVWLLSIVWRHHPRAGVAAAVVLLILTAAWGLAPSLRALERQRESDAVLATLTRVVKAEVEPGSIVIAERLIQQQLDFVGRWRLVDESIVTRPARRLLRRADLDANRPSPRPARWNDDRLTRYDGLRGGALYDAFSEDVWAWAGKEHRVYWIATQDQLDRVQEELWEWDRLSPVATIDMPERAVPEFRPGPPGIGPRRGSGRPVGRRGRGDAAPPRMAALRAGEPLVLVEWTREY
jgi:4-amino-4-deoxy-L-arabinose transferase-like glycosyltransferase